MFKKFLLVVSFLILAGTSAFSAPLKVWASLLPENESNMGRKPVSLHFNQPVVGLGEQTAFASDKCPFTITPKIEGECYYSGTNTLVFEPKADWPKAMRYTITLPAGYASNVSKQALAKPYVISFNTALPRVQQVIPYDGERWIASNPVIYVKFTMPVKPEAKFVTLWTLGQKKHVPVEVRAVNKEEFEQVFRYEQGYEKVLAVTPLESLKKDTKYTLSLKQGLPAQEGTQGLAKAYHTNFYTYPSLKIVGSTSEGCLPFNPSVDFSAPVRMSELVRAVSVTPKSARKALSKEEMETLGYEVFDKEKNTYSFRMPLSFLDIKPEQEVQVSISGDLQDISGAKLGQDYTFVVSNTGYCPKADFADGFGILESYLKPYLPIDVMNITGLPMEAARFNKDNFIAFNEKENKYCAKAELANPTFAGEYAFKDVHNKTLNTFLDLSRFGLNEKDSIIFTQIKLQKERDDSDCWKSATTNVTDIGVTFKTSPTSTLIWTTSLREGGVLPNVPVELRDSKNQVLWTGRTNENGLALAPGWKDLQVTAENKWYFPTLYAFASGSGGDAVVSNKWNDGLEPWRFNINYSYNIEPELLSGYLFTERGIYRRNEKVYIKGVLREQKNDGWTIPQLKAGVLSISDARGQEVLAKEVALSENATFDFAYDIGKDAPTGTWSASFIPLQNGKRQETDFATTFQVQAVKQADFQVHVVPQHAQYMGGEKAVYNVASNYQFGAPVTNAKAKWSFSQEYAAFEPEGYKDYSFVPANVEYYKTLNSGSGVLDAKGTLQIVEQLPQVDYPVKVYGEVSVTSPANQELFSRSSVMVHPSDFYIGLKTPNDSFFEVGKPIALDVIALTPDGARVPAIATAKIYKYNWYSVRKSGLSGRLEWINEREKVELPEISVGIGMKNSQVSFVPQESGSYFIELSATDTKGRTVTSQTNVYVYGKGENSWKKNDDDILTLTQDKNEYKVGQKARILVQSPYPNALALVSVERAGILDAWVEPINSASSFITIPIKENYLPNAYVSVVLVRGRSGAPVTDRTLDLGKPQLKVGYVNLNVIPDGKKIATSVKANAEKYRPGDKVSLQISTKVKGKAVPAEVAVMVVDEGMLALTDYKTPDLFRYFYGEKPLGVSTMDNRSYVIGQRSFGEKGENRGGGGATSAKLGGVDLRSNFSFVPYYQGVVQTNKKGAAAVSFTLPDNLTKFRVMAVSIRENEFGAGETSFKVSKPIMVTPHLPRFLRKGDSFTCGAVVYNFEDKNGLLNVQAQATGAVSLLDEAQQFVYVPSGESRHVSWKCKAETDGKAEFALVLQSQKESDGVKVPLEVLEVERAQTLSAYEKLSGSEMNFLLHKPANVYAQADNHVAVMMASTALLNLKSAISYLLTYPYDCLEQKMSKILPVIVSEKMVKDFHLGDVELYKKQTQQVLDEIPLYQVPTGGLAYWKNSRVADPYVTAYALETAFEAQKASYRVPEKELQQAVKWLATAFNKDTRNAYDYSVREMNMVRAYASYVLALYGQNVDSLFNNLYIQREALNASATAYLLRTAYLTKQEREVQRTLIQQLSKNFAFTTNSTFVEEKESAWLHVNDVTATALTLRVLLNERPVFEYAYKMVTWLLDQMNRQGHWSNTYANALVLQALSDYYTLVEKEEPNFEAFVNQGYRQLLLHRFKGRSLDNATAVFPFEKFYGNTKEQKITFIKHGTGTLYYTTLQNYVPKAFSKPVNSGFTIERTLTTLDGKPVTAFYAGERYKVTLKVKNANARHFVVLEDFIAAGLEIANTSLATESHQQDKDLNENNWLNGFVRAERYDDRLAAFADYLPAGEHEYSYIVSAVAQGEYAYPAAWVSLMYEPSVFGRTTTTQLVIK